MPDEEITRMHENAEPNDDGDLIWEKTVPAAAGGTRTHDVNVTKLLRPGGRKTGEVDHLVIEAELHAEGKGGGNPARPANAETAKAAIERIEARGLDPAWRQVENAGQYP